MSGLKDFEGAQRSIVDSEVDSAHRNEYEKFHTIMENRERFREEAEMMNINEFLQQKISFTDADKCVQETCKTILDSHCHRMEHNRLVGQWLNEEKGISGQQQTSESIKILNQLLSCVQSESFQIASEDTYLRNPSLSIMKCGD